jgi:hypothetical protein
MHNPNARACIKCGAVRVQLQLPFPEIDKLWLADSQSPHFSPATSAPRGSLTSRAASSTRRRRTALPAATRAASPLGNLNDLLKGA